MITHKIIVEICGSIERVITKKWPYTHRSDTSRRRERKCVSTRIYTCVFLSMTKARGQSTEFFAPVKRQFPLQKDSSKLKTIRTVEQHESSAGTSVIRKLSFG